MRADLALQLMSELFWTAIVVSAPVLALTMLVGLIVSVLQVVTQVQEMSLAFVPKLLAATLGLIAFGSWMLRSVGHYWTQLWSSIPSLF
ncbi:MAG: flagellar biosynthetic protein FliQ [Anaeromyxobacter sp.]